MNKFLKYITGLLLLATAMVSCTKESLTDCPPENPYNAYLRFEYLNGGVDKFSDNVNTVRLFVYNDAGELVHNQDITKAELLELQGVQLSLPAGNYKVVCWGNADDETSITDWENFETAKLHHPALFDDSKSIPTNDPLFYGRLFDLTVPVNGIVEGVVPYESAHVNMRIVVPAGDDITKAPIIVAQGFFPQYDFNKDFTTQGIIEYHPTSITYDPETNQWIADFKILRYTNDKIDENPEIDIEVWYDPVDYENGENPDIEGGIDISQELEDVVDSGGNDLAVEIKISQDLYITVKIIGWTGNDLNPEI